MRSPYTVVNPGLSQPPAHGHLKAAVRFEADLSGMILDLYLDPEYPLDFLKHAG